uniref:Uncharacterized protein n=1 Tax=Anguilla anguilla TaxID=7936 RepID=A0A0E9V568_ANGAN
MQRRPTVQYSLLSMLTMPPAAADSCQSLLSSNSQRQ